VLPFTCFDLFLFDVVRVGRLQVHVQGCQHGFPGSGVQSDCLDLSNHASDDILITRDDSQIFCAPVRPIQVYFFDSLRFDKLYPDHFELDLAEKIAEQALPAIWFYQAWALQQTVACITCSTADFESF
jgi:hypothetical protein